MILFLDFDGVLHPYSSVPHTEIAQFCLLPSLENWLRSNETIKVVISSSWRLHLDLGQLRALFCEDIGPRIIDRCPIERFEGNAQYWRYEVIKRWINQSQYQGPWVALDDAIEEFPHGFDRLVACDKWIGLTPENLEEVERNFNDQLNKE